MELPLTQDKVAILDDDCPSTVFDHKWRYGAGYAVTSVVQDGKEKTLALHRLVTGAAEGFVVDHKNGDTLDNRLSNLRVCTFAQNTYNRKKRADGVGSEFKGVSRNPGDTSYGAEVSCNGERYYLGKFKTEIEAAAAYNLAAIEIFGEFARLNDVPKDIVPKRLLRPHSSQHTGISYSRPRKKWVAQIYRNGSVKYIGSYDTEEEAVKARKEAFDKIVALEEELTYACAA